MTADPVQKAAGGAARPAAGWQWLHYAAEMAALVSGQSLLTPGPQWTLAPVAPGTLDDAWTCFPKVAMRTPAVDAGSISAARKFTSQTLHRWGCADRDSDVAVVVSELLSNALRHGLSLADGLTSLPARRTSPIRLGLLHSGSCVMCAVADPSDQMPVPREASWLDESGRGLHVIASLSDKWGSCAAPERPGKVVWATFATQV